MSASAHPRQAERADVRTEVLIAGLVLLALYNLGLALFMVVSPHSFFTSIGPFGDYNRHYLGDLATYGAAIGAGCAVALRRASWRVPVLAISTLQFALHTINHLVDIDAAHPAWTGYFDFFSLLVTTLTLAWLTVLALGRSAERDALTGSGR